MKKIFLITLVLVTGLILRAQTPAAYDSTRQLQKVSTYGQEWGNFKVKNSFWLPNGLTTTYKVADSNALVFNGGKIYYWNGYSLVQVAGGGGGSVTLFSASSLNPLFDVAVSNPSTTPALSFTLKNVSNFQIYGRKDPGIGVPSFLTADSTLIPDLHSEAYYDTRYLSAGTLYNLEQVTAIGNSTPYDIQIVPGFGSWLDLGGQSITFGQTAGSYTGTLQRPSMTANRLWTLPDNTGTIALTSDIPAASGFWKTIGNTGTVPGTDFIGTTDSKGFMGKVNNVQSLYLDYIHGNSSFGQSALLNNTTGISNNAFGDSALRLNTTGSYGSAFGNSTLKSNTTGTGNSGFGYQSIFTNTTGQGLTAIGFQSLYSNTSGDNNVAIGASALRTNATGYSNTAVGASALYQNVSGAQNSAFGLNSLTKNTGHNNSAFGYVSLAENTSGLANNAFGLGALQFTTTGSTNSAFGVNTLNNNTTGSSNVAFGSAALGNNTTGSRNIALGIYAGSNTNAAYSDRLYISSVFSAGAGLTVDSLKGIIFGYQDTATASQRLYLNSQVYIPYMASGVGTKAVRINPSTGLLTYADTTSGGSSGATVALDNLSGVAINTSLLLGSSDGGALGSTTKQWSDLFLAEGGVINFDNGDATITQAGNVVTLAGADLTVPNITVGSLTSGRVALVGASGLLQDDAGLTFDGTTNALSVTGPATDVNALPSGSLKFNSDANAAMNLMAYDHDNMRINFDAYYDYSANNYLSSTTLGNFSLLKNNSKFQIQTANAVAAGSAITWASMFELTTAGALRLNGYTAGTLVTDGSGNVTASSDRRIKHNIKLFKFGLGDVLKVNPSTFIYNQDSSNTVMPGFIAQNIQDAFGGLGVGQQKDGMLTLNTNVILAATVNAIKELKDLNDKQQKEIDKLKLEIKKLKK